MCCLPPLRGPSRPSTPTTWLRGLAEPRVGTAALGRLPRWPPTTTSTFPSPSPRRSTRRTGSASKTSWPRGAQGAPVRGQGEVRQLSLLPRSRSGDLVLLAPAAPGPRGGELVVPVVGGRSRGVRAAGLSLVCCIESAVTTRFAIAGIGAGMRGRAEATVPNRSASAFQSRVASSISWRAADEVPPHQEVLGERRTSEQQCSRRSPARTPRSARCVPR